MTQDAPLDPKALEARLASIRNFVSGALADVKIASALPMVANEYDFDSAVGSLTNAHIELGMLADALFSSVPAAGAELDSKALKAATSALLASDGYTFGPDDLQPWSVHSKQAARVVTAYNDALSRRVPARGGGLREALQAVVDEVRNVGSASYIREPVLSKAMAALAAAPSIPEGKAEPVAVTDAMVSAFASAAHLGDPFAPSPHPTLEKARDTMAGRIRDGLAAALSTSVKP